MKHLKKYISLICALCLIFGLLSGCGSSETENTETYDASKEMRRKIREIANNHDIPIIENIPLARLMYKEVDIDQEIPEEMYKAVAEVLVAVYKLKNKYK